MCIILYRMRLISSILLSKLWRVRQVVAWRRLQEIAFVLLLLTLLLLETLCMRAALCSNVRSRWLLRCLCVLCARANTKLYGRVNERVPSEILKLRLRFAFFSSTLYSLLVLVLDVWKISQLKIWKHEIILHANKCLLCASVLHCRWETWWDLNRLDLLKMTCMRAKGNLLRDDDLCVRCAMGVFYTYAWEMDFVYVTASVCCCISFVA